MEAAQLNPESVMEFVTAGAAVFTLRSEKTGARFTYKITKPTNWKNGMRVHILAGPNNQGDFRYAGFVNPANELIHGGQKSNFGQDTPSWKALAWFWARVVRAGLPSENCTVWHEGRCGRCGRPLTVPESIATGLGPICASKVAA